MYIKPNQFVFNNILICLFLTSIHAIQSSDIFAGNSYSAQNLSCGTFKIGNSCTINNVVKAESGEVGNSMKAQEIYINKNLKVGTSLTTNILKCKSFDVKNRCTINNTVEAESGTVGTSMEIKKGGTIHQSLVVGNTLTCFKTHISIFAQLYIIRAKESSVGEVYIKNTYSVIETKGSTVNITSISNFFLPYLYSFVYYLINKVKSFFWTVPDNHDQFLNDSSMEEEISTFENCTVGSIVVDKNNNKKQIIELKNTTVSGDITFANGTHGEVKRSGLTHVNGKVHNSLYQNDDTVYHNSIQNAAAPSF